MTRVAANLAWLTPGRVGGSEEYTVRLLEAVIAAAPDDIELSIHGSAALRDAHPALAAVPFHTIPGPVAKRPYRLIAESTIVHRRTRDADLVHHFGGRLPGRRHGCDVVTIHDLQPLEMPDNFSGAKAAYLRRALPRTARGAQHICTPSQWVADTVASTFGVAAANVSAISSSHAADGPVDDALAGSLGPGPVVLYPAMTHPHKNHFVLIAAVAALAESRPGLQLVLTGGPGRADAEVRAAIDGSSNISHVGRVSRATLRGLYHRADVVAFPSRYEGFGLPVIEAFSHQTEVVAADATALPEVVGDAGTLVDPDDADGWRTALDEALRRSASPDRSNATMNAQVARYQPAAAAERLMDVWRSLRCDSMQVGR